MAAMLKFDIRKRYVADHCIERIFRQSCIPEILNAYVVLRMDSLGNRSRRTIQFDADGMCILAGLAQEIADTATWL